MILAIISLLFQFGAPLAKPTAMPTSAPTSISHPQPSMLPMQPTAMPTPVPPK